jgi:tetratricopeptide (TPR) repeat protein
MEVESMRTRIWCISFLFLIVFSCTATGIADDEKDDVPLVLVTDFIYRAGNMDSLEKSRALAVFEAKKKAVVLAAEHFMQRGLLKNYGKQASEIFCLAANKIKTRIIQETYTEKEKQYSIKIKAEVDILDFMEAEIENQVFEKEESNFPWKEEMEQNVSGSIDPARELSRAYRYIRKDETRIAIIYLDHLVKKYPNWSDVYYLRAMGFQRMQYVDQMVKDLEKACFLNHQEACNALGALR